MQRVKSTAVDPASIRLLLGGIGLAMLGSLVYLSPTTTAWLLVLGTFSIAAAWLFWHHPELGLLIVSFLGASLIPREQVVVSVVGYHLDPADVVLVGLLALFVARGLRRNTLEIPRWSITGPLVAFAGIALFSAVYALFAQGVSPVLVVGELRPAAYCVACAIVAATLVRRQQLMILVIGLFMIADLTAAAVVLHQFGGTDPSLTTTSLPGNWQISLVGGSLGGFGSVRVVPAGHVLMYLMANVAFCLLLRPPKIPWARVVMALQFTFLGVGLVLTYTRGQWVASGIALLLICACLPRATQRSLGRLVVVPILVVALWLGASWLLPSGGAGLTQALASRVTSIVTPSDTLSTDSLEWRAFENDAAIASLSAHPFLGVGLGNDYRDITLLQGEANGSRWQLGGPGRLTRWVHNSYLYVAAKMGLPALGIFLWFCVAFLIGGARIYFKLPVSTEKFVVLAIVCSFAGLLEWVVFEAHLMLPSGMITLGLMVGIVVAAGSLRFIGTNLVRVATGSRPADSVP
jgi:O-Antigen ligase